MNNNVVRYKTFGNFSLLENVREFIDSNKDRIDIVTVVSGDTYTAVYYQYKNTYSDTDLNNKEFEL